MRAIDVTTIHNRRGVGGGWCVESMSRLTGLGIVVRSLPQRPDTANPGIRGGISAGERQAGNWQRGLISRTYRSEFCTFH